MTEELIYCDNCSQPCESPTGDDGDGAMFCCKCAWERWERFWIIGIARFLCELCSEDDDPIQPDGLRLHDPRDHEDAGIPKPGM